MKVELLYTPNGIRTLKGALKMSQDMARQCYSGKSPGEIKSEAYKPQMVDPEKGVLVTGGHQSVFDHFNMTINLSGIPKAMAMVLNNEPPYTTSEKSARYTKMSGLEENQKILYDKWLGILTPAINQAGVLIGSKNRDVRAGKLAQENARYLTSAFTPTNMNYTISLRHMNELADKFERFREKISSEHVAGSSKNLFFERLILGGMNPFLNSEVVQRFRVERIKHKGGDNVRLFGASLEERFGKDDYATNLPMSIACLAQAHRHRTIDYHISDGLELGGNLGFFIPPIVEHIGRTDEWLEDIASVAEYDFPQGQLLMVAERGTRTDLMTKADERICGPAQLEIMNRTAELAKKYEQEVPGVRMLSVPPCIDNPCDKGGCPTGKKSLDRIV